MTCYRLRLLSVLLLDDTRNNPFVCVNLYLCFEGKVGGVSYLFLLN